MKKLFYGLLLSIKPQHALNILNGTKTLELRNSVPKGFKGWVYVYVTKSKPYLHEYASWFIDGEDFSNSYKLLDKIFEYSNNAQYGRNINGTIPFRFWFDEYETIKWDNAIFTRLGWEGYFISDHILNRLCLNIDEVFDYGNGKDLYAWHIKKLEIFDKPMVLGEFFNYKHYINNIGNVSISAQKICGIKENIDETKDSLECYRYTYDHMMKSTYGVTVKRPPQSYQYVWVKGE